MTSGEGFGKNERLLKSKDFRKIYTGGRKFSVGGAAICCLENALGHDRLGFSISTRNFKLASARNRIRRLFREAYRRNKSSSGAGLDIIIIVKRGFDKKTPYKEAERVFKGMMGKVRSS